ncbi:imidazoleglycerol-phosphate dehydratase HisB [candidate division KSB1 bacterium]|nr:imidazoleglycerol-phosphate dehydratase HisB [candidate division KSB1 bacterium]
MSRKAKIERKTAETDIRLELNLDGRGEAEISTGIGFFDHLLQAFVKHSSFDMHLEATGDLHVDAHHTVEDVGIVIGQALDIALSDRRGIERFGSAYCPLDEALVRAVVDISGRGFLAYRAELPQGQVGVFPTELMEEFLRAVAVNGRLTLHVDLLDGKNRHHCLEAMIKATARALRLAVFCHSEKGTIPSTKGVLS